MNGPRSEASGGARGALDATPHAWVAVAITVLAVASYANSLAVPFAYDDFANFVYAPWAHAIRLDAQLIANAAHAFPFGRWLANLSFALNHLAGGQNPTGYHIVNLVFHVGSALFVYALALEILRRREHLAATRTRIAGLTALLFSVHPVHTQAVTYVVQRMTSMGGFFAFAALWLYMRARRPEVRRPWAWAAASACSAYLALSCKETYVTLPLLALLMEWLFVPGFADRIRARRTLAVGGAAALLAVGALLFARYWPVIVAEQARFGLSVGERLLSQGRVVLHYMSLLALPLPSRLHVDYDWAASRGWLDPPTTLVGVVSVVFLIWSALLARKRTPMFTFAALWFLAALAVEQTILPIDLAFEHRLYMPSFGPLLLAAVGIERAAVGVDGKRRFFQPRRLARPAAAVAVLLLAWATHARNEVWRDPVRLFADDGGGARTQARTLLTLADAQLAAGRPIDAEQTLRRVLAIEPQNVGAVVNLATVAWRKGDLAGAERLYRDAIARAPGSTEAFYNLGCLLAEEGREAEAAEAFGHAIEADRRFVRPYANLARIELRRGDAVRARALLDEAIAIDPGYVLAYENRAALSLGQGRYADALDDARAATRLARDAEAYALLGDALRGLGRTSDAAAAYAEALSIDATNPRATSGRRRLVGN